MTYRAGEDTTRECLHCKECGGSGCPECDVYFFDDVIFELPPRNRRVLKGTVVRRG